MTWRTQINEKGVVTRYCDTDSGEVISPKEYERRMQMQQGGYSNGSSMPGMYSSQSQGIAGGPTYATGAVGPGQLPVYAPVPGQDSMIGQPGMSPGMSAAAPPPPPQAMSPMNAQAGNNPLIQRGAQMLGPDASNRPMQSD